jgi:transketolase
MPKLSKLKKRILEIAYKYKLSHLGSYLSSVDIIESIYKKKDKDDIFILSSGHAALALYVVLEKYENRNAIDLFNRYGGHPVRSEEDGIYCSTGSLGTGLTIAVGRAIANPSKFFFVLISDGETAEGSVWESLRFISENYLNNIEVHVNINGYGAYDVIDKDYLSFRLKSFLPNIILHETTVNQTKFLNGLNAHYYVMDKKDFESL